MVRKGEGVQRGGLLPPPVGKTSPTHASEPWREWEGPRVSPPINRSCEICSCSMSGHHLAFSRSTNLGDVKRRGGDDLLPSPLSEWVEGETKWEGAVQNGLGW